jgi:hypothetical protein
VTDDPQPRTEHGQPLMAPRASPPFPEPPPVPARRPRAQRRTPATTVVFFAALTVCVAAATLAVAVFIGVGL